MKILVMLILMSVGIGCMSTTTERLDEFNNYYFENDIKVSSVTEIMNWIKDNIKYTIECEICDYWQTPEQTYIRGKGDCEDKAILFMYLMKVNLGISPEFVVVDNLSTGKGHAIVLFHGNYWEVEYGTMIPNLEDTVLRFNYSLPYKATMELTYNYHGINNM